jgi:hypothetical protein
MSITMILTLISATTGAAAKIIEVVSKNKNQK